MEVSSLYLQHVVISLVYFSILHVHFSFSLAQRSAKNGLFLLMIRLIHISIYFYRKKLFHHFTTIFCNFINMLGFFASYTVFVNILLSKC